MIEIRGGLALHQARTVMVRSHREELFAAFGSMAKTRGGYLFLVQRIEPADESLVTRDRHGLKWDPELTRRWTNQAEDAGQGFCIMHAHPTSAQARLSGTDERTCSRLLGHFENHLPDRLCGYMLFAESTVVGTFTVNEQRQALGCVRTVGCPMERWGRNQDEERAIPTAMTRLVSAITEDGARRLADSTVAIIGLGGAGSTVADQLAHMGVGHLMLCDGDILKDVNLSRQTGAGPADYGEFKASVAERTIRHANPTVKVSLFVEEFPHPDSYLALREADLVVSCVDSAAARHEINKFGRRYLVPIIDVGATIRRRSDDLNTVSGHTARILPDSACLECLGLTTSALRDAETAEREGRYGVTGAPQIMSVNGVLASMAATEVLRMISGLSTDIATRHWRYEALEGEVYALDAPTIVCAVCSLRGAGDGNAGASAIR